MYVCKYMDLCISGVFIEFPSEDINRHITTVTDFLRNNYDTVDSAGTF